MEEREIREIWSRRIWCITAAFKTKGQCRKKCKRPLEADTGPWQTVRKETRTSVLWPQGSEPCQQPQWLWEQDPPQSLQGRTCLNTTMTLAYEPLSRERSQDFWLTDLCDNEWVLFQPANWCWSSSTLATSCEELTHWKRPLTLGGMGAGGEGDNRGWDGWMASPTPWTWVWINFVCWWWTGKPGVLWFMGSQRVGHDWVTELNWCIGSAWHRKTDTGRKEKKIPAYTSAGLGPCIFQTSEMEWIFLMLCKVLLFFKGPKMCPMGTGPDSHDSVFRITLLSSWLKLSRASFHDDKFL